VSTEADLYDAFATAFATFAAGLSPALPVSWPGIHFTPPDEGSWLELRLFPNETQNYGLADDAPALHQGMLQVGVCTRPGGGIVDALQVAGAVVAAFPKGTQVGPVSVQRKPWISGVLTESDRIVHPVTIPYRGFVA
jgi:hypothetical protein